MKNEEKAKEIANKYVALGFDCTFTSERYEAAMEMAEWKEKQIKEILLAYTKWLDKRGFFQEELQFDFKHQIETFLEII